MGNKAAVVAAIMFKEGGDSGFIYGLKQLGFKPEKGGEIGNVPVTCPVRSGKAHGSCFADTSKSTWNCFYVGGGCPSSCRKGGSLTTAVETFWGAEEIEKYLRNHGQEANSSLAKASGAELRKEYYHTCFTAAEKAYKYAEGRGIPLDVSRKAGLAYAQGWVEINILRKRGASDKQLEDAGLLRKSGPDKKLVPQFWNRLLVCSGDRLYGRETRPGVKIRPHINSKGNVLPWSPTPIPSKDITRFIIVEAPLDALSIAALKEANEVVFATFGTQGVDKDGIVSFIRKYGFNGEILVVPDCDPWRDEKGAPSAPGQLAGLAKAEAFARAGFMVRVGLLPFGTDPNDLTAKLKWSSVDFRRMVNGAMSPVVYRIYCAWQYFAQESNGTRILPDANRQAFLNKAKAIVSHANLSKGEIPAIAVSKIAAMANHGTGSPLTVEDVKAFLEDAFEEAYARQYVEKALKAGLDSAAIVKRLTEK